MRIGHRRARRLGSEPPHRHHLPSPPRRTRALPRGSSSRRSRARWTRRARARSRSRSTASAVSSASRTSARSPATRAAAARWCDVASTPGVDAPPSLDVTVTRRGARGGETTIILSVCPSLDATVTRRGARGGETTIILSVHDTRAPADGIRRVCRLLVCLSSPVAPREGRLGRRRRRLWPSLSLRRST